MSSRFIIFGTLLGYLFALNLVVGCPSCPKLLCSCNYSNPVLPVYYWTISHMHHRITFVSRALRDFFTSSRVCMKNSILVTLSARCRIGISTRSRADILLVWLMCVAESLNIAKHIFWASSCLSGCSFLILVVERRETRCYINKMPTHPNTQLGSQQYNNLSKLATKKT